MKRDPDWMTADELREGDIVQVVDVVGKNDVIAKYCYRNHTCAHQVIKQDKTVVVGLGNSINSKTIFRFTYSFERYQFLGRWK